MSWRPIVRRCQSQGPVIFQFLAIELTISDVLYILSITRNLLSIGKLTDQGHSVLFDSKLCYIMDNRKPTSILLRGTSDPLNKLYKLNVPDVLTDTHSLNRSVLTHPSISQCHMTEPRYSQAQLWHQRLGHSHYQCISRIYDQAQSHSWNSTPTRCKGNLWDASKESRLGIAFQNLLLIEPLNHFS